MADLIFVSIIVAFFALCVAYLRWCDRIIGADDFTTAPADMSPAASPTESIEVDA
jgi:hypothetical protein